MLFKSRGRIASQVRILWGDRSQEPWILATNLPEVSGWEYAQRMWQEESFRDLKSYGWQLEDTQFDAPDRLARLWIMLVTTYVWLVFWGDDLEQQGLTHPRTARPDGTLVRRLSLFQEGLLAFENHFCPLRIQCRPLSPARGVGGPNQRLPKNQR